MGFFVTKLPKTLQNQLALSCYAIVSHHFAVFQNPEMRGPAFEWARFPQMMRTQCAAGVFLNTAIPERHAEAARQHAEATGFQIAENLVGWMMGTKV